MFTKRQKESKSRKLADKVGFIQTNVYRLACICIASMASVAILATCASSGGGSGTTTPAPTITATAAVVQSATGSVIVTWTEPTNADFLGVSITYTVAGGTASTPVTVAKGTTTRTFTGLTAGAAYTFTVSAVNGSGTLAAGTVSTTTVVTATVDRLPIIITHVGALAVNTNIGSALKTGALATATNFMIAATPAVCNTNFKINADTGQISVKTALTSGGTDNCSITFSGVSANPSLAVAISYGSIDNITNLRITAINHNVITIGWTNPTVGLAGVYVERSTSTTAPANCAAKTPSTAATSHSFTGLTANTVYSFSYRVCAHYTGDMVATGVVPNGLTQEIAALRTCVAAIGTGAGTMASPFVIDGMAGAGVTHATNVNPSDNSVPRYAFSFCGVPADSVNRIRASIPSSLRVTNANNFELSRIETIAADGTTVLGDGTITYLVSSGLISNVLASVVHTAHGNILLRIRQGGLSTNAFWGQAEPARTAFPGAYPATTSAISALRPQNIMLTFTLEKN